MVSIEIVQSTGYLAFLEPVKESANCYTHFGQIHSTINGTYTGYIKFYPDEINNSKGLVNEVCGYLLAKAAGIPTSRYGMILLVERARLLEAHPKLKTILPNNHLFPTWVTEQVPGFRLRSGDEHAIAALRTWSDLPRIVAFDDWVLNSDRNLENLIRSKKMPFTAIDHGHIFGGLNWDHTLLTPDMPFSHPFMVELWGNRPPPEITSRILEAAHDHATTLENARPELKILLNKLLENQADREQALLFLERRASQSYDRMKKGLGMLL